MNEHHLEEILCPTKCENCKGVCKPQNSIVAYCESEKKRSLHLASFYILLCKSFGLHLKRFYVQMMLSVRGALLRIYFMPQNEFQDKHGSSPVVPYSCSIYQNIVHYKVFLWK